MIPAGLLRLAPRRLSSRIVAMFLGLLLLVQAAGFAAISGTIERNARRTLAEELVVGERIWRRLLDQKAQSLVQGATVLAADYGFRSAIGTGDTDTLVSVLQNHSARIRADVSAWVDTEMQVRAVNDPGGRAGGAATVRRIATELARSQRDSMVARVDDRAYQFIGVPMKAPLHIGWVVMGFPIDQALVDDMHALSGLDVVLTGSDKSAPGSPDTSLVSRRVELGGGASVTLTRSVEQAIAPFRQLQWLLLVISVVGVLVSATGSVFTARRITTPLSSLVLASERLGRGEYGEPMGHTERKDEIGDLAKAFDHMRLNIAAQQGEIRQLAYWDRLTGLPNRTHFREAVAAAIDAARAHQSSVSVVMLDLNRFKHVNDVLGYQTGDRLLKAVAERLSGQLLRKGDMVARLSGDEFALLLLGIDGPQSLAVAQRIADVFELPLTLDDQTIDLSAGFGIACWPAHASDADALLSRAEIAMYAAKRTTAVTMVYDPSIDAASAQTLSLLSELRRALERSELRIFLQPKISLAHGHLVGAEALLRWQHPTRGLLLPIDFIPFAEQTGFVRQLTLWVFEAAAMQWTALRRLGLQRVSVNLSTRDLLDAELPSKLDAILARHHVPATAFCLEITESAIMDEPQRAETTLNALSASGFKLSIDDFGTGYSSLAYLKRLPVDELKIDKSFVMAMENDVDDAKIVRSTIDLAHNLGLTVVAEGVENAAVWHQLRALDCDEAQGYHISRPLPAHELAAFAARWHDPATEMADAEAQQH